MALAAYRSLIRSVRIAFQGDATILNAALHQSRKGFETNRNATEETRDVLIKEAFGIADMVRKNIVQGKWNEEDKTYKLRIHDDIEKGDNKSIKHGGKMFPGDKGGCCQTS